MAAQTLGSTSTATAVAPRVNLLPPEIAEQSRLRRAQLAMVGTGLAAVAVVGVLYTQQVAKVSEAESAKADAAAKTVTLRRDLADLQNVKDTFQQVDQAKLTLATAMRYEVYWSGYLHDMTLTIPENVWLTSYTVKMDPSKAAGDSGSSRSPVLLDPGLGTVTLTGVAFTHDDVAAWLESLSKQKGYTNPYFTESVEEPIGERNVVRFTSTVNLTEKSLSNRYTKTKGLAR